MNDRARFVMRVYRVLLSFYPAAFRDEFGEEMQASVRRGAGGSAIPGWRTTLAAVLAGDV